MFKKVKIKKYYAMGFLPIALVLAILSVFPLSIELKCYLLLGYMWNFSLATFPILQRANTRKYKLSFLRLIVGLYNALLWLVKKENSFVEAAVRSVSPLIFTTLLAFTSGWWNLLWCLLGSAIFEIYFYFYLIKVEIEAAETLQDSLNEEISP